MLSILQQLLTSYFCDSYMRNYHCDDRRCLKVFISADSFLVRVLKRREIRGCSVVNFMWHFCMSRIDRERGTQVCRYNGHSAGSLVWPFPMLKYKYIFSYKIYGSNFVKQHSETVMVWNYQNADCSFKNKFIVLFITIFGTLVLYGQTTSVSAYS